MEVSEFPPSDLAHLCTLVNGITGPGLRHNRISQQIEFITPGGDGLKEAFRIPVRYNEDLTRELDNGGANDPFSGLWLD